MKKQNLVMALILIFSSAGLFGQVISGDWGNDNGSKSPDQGGGFEFSSNILGNSYREVNRELVAIDSLVGSLKANLLSLEGQESISILFDGKNAKGIGTLYYEDEAIPKVNDFISGINSALVKQRCMIKNSNASIENTVQRYFGNERTMIQLPIKCLKKKRSGILILSMPEPSLISKSTLKRILNKIITLTIPSAYAGNDGSEIVDTSESNGDEIKSGTRKAGASKWQSEGFGKAVMGFFLLTLVGDKLQDSNFNPDVRNGNGLYEDFSEDDIDGEGSSNCIFCGIPGFPDSLSTPISFPTGGGSSGGSNPFEDGPTEIEVPSN